MWGKIELSPYFIPFYTLMLGLVYMFIRISGGSFRLGLAGLDMVIEVVPDFPGVVIQIRIG